MNLTLKVGIIGVGVTGNRHIQAFKSNNNSEVVAVADIDKKTA